MSAKVKWWSSGLWTARFQYRRTAKAASVTTPRSLATLRFTSSKLMGSPRSPRPRRRQQAARGSPAHKRLTRALLSQGSGQLAAAEQVVEHRVELVHALRAHGLGRGLGDGRGLEAPHALGRGPAHVVVRGVHPRDALEVVERLVQAAALLVAVADLVGERHLLIRRLHLRVQA